MRLSLSALLVLFVPGWSLLAWLPRTSRERRGGLADVLSLLADGAAFSVALSALAALALFIVRARLAPEVLVGLYGACLLALLVALFRRRIRLPAGGQALILGFLALALVAALAAWRFYQARDLVLPAWVDSVHHVLIVRNILAYRGLPPDLAPDLPVPFYYHYGFHVMAALFSFWSRLPPAESVLWFGQVINSAVALSVYRLAAALTATGDQDAAPPRACNALPILALLFTGFMFQMPAYYLSWGRYTLLSGLILLGPLMAAGWQAAAAKPAAAPGKPAAPGEPGSDQPPTGSLVRLALLVAGMCLTHYFALLLAGLFLLVLGAWRVVLLLRGRSTWRQDVLWRLAGWTLLGVLAAAPWLWRVWQFNQSTSAVRVISPLEQDAAAMQGALDYLRYTIFLIGPRYNHILMGMAGAGLLIALRRQVLRPVMVWALLLILLSLPWGPRFGPFRPDHFAIVLFFPAALALGELIAAGAAALGSLARGHFRWRAWIEAATLLLVTGLFLIWGWRETRTVINPVTVLATQADVMALDWVKDNTPPDARFYINNTLWQSGSYRGVDGGYWLLPYSGRSSMIPPVVYVWGTPEYVQRVNDWARRSANIESCTPEFWNLVRDAGLTHLYLRDGFGPLRASALADCPRLEPVYQQAGVSIFEIRLPD